MTPAAVGLDVGTTNTKAVVVDVTTDTAIALASTPTPVGVGEDGPVRDATAVAVAVRQVLDQALQAAGDVEVLAVCTASVGEEVVLLDANGSPLAEVPVWYGPHGAKEAERWSGVEGAEVLSRLDPTFSAFKLAWYARHRPAALARAATWVDLSGFVAAHLLGRGADGAVVDTSHASRTGLLDLRRRCWDPTPLDVMGITKPLPRLWESGTVIDVTEAPVGRLPAGVPVVAGGHDHFCGAFGAGLDRGGTAYLSAGTSEAQLVVSREVPDTAGGVEVGCYVTDGLYYAHLPMPSGRLYQRWRDLLWGADADDAAVLASIDGAAPPRLAVEVDRRTGDAHLHAVPLEVTREELMAALMVGVARQADEVTDLLATASGRPVDRVLVAGAPAASPVWRRLRQAVTQRDLVFVSEAEVTAAGAARLGARGIGRR